MYKEQPPTLTVGGYLFVKKCEKIKIARATSVAFFEDYILQKAKPMTWVIIGHQLSNIKRLCNYTYFMHDGKICSHGPTGELLHNPEDAKLRQYLQYI